MERRRTIDLINSLALQRNCANYPSFLTAIAMGGHDHCIPSRTQPDPDVRGSGEPGIQCETDKGPKSISMSCG